MTDVRAIEVSETPLLVQRVRANTLGRDFVVGDIHGCFDAVRAALEDVAFNPARDRLFSVGDLVDRGPSSEEVIDWLAEPWFLPVRGNHEQMAIGVAAGRHDHARYILNGGGWFLALPDSRRKLFALSLGTLPLAIEIDHPAGRIGIVHADVPCDNWCEFTAALERRLSGRALNTLMKKALWSRSRFDERDESGVDGAAMVFVGHSPTREPLVLGNVIHIDTGAVFGGKLKLVEIGEWVSRFAPAEAC